MENIHTFAICAYKESEHLEKCIQSLLAQTVPSHIYISTSTPNEYISHLAKKYHLEVYPTNNPSDIQDDWNSAYNLAKTPLVTVAHQDDVYGKHYAQIITQAYKKNQKGLIYYTDYLPIKDNKVGKRDINSKIKRFLRIPLKSQILSKRKFWKVASLAFGNSISCPSVTYNKQIIGENVFTSSLKFGLDWDTFLKLAREKGDFVYIDQPVFFYRVYDGATTKQFIVDNTRQKEDIIMFNKIWPSWITKIMMKFYTKAYDTYD